MKLSEMNNKDAIKVVCKLTPSIKKIVSDKKVLKVWYRKLEIKEGASSVETKIEQSKYVAEKLLDLVPLILENHEQDVYKMLSVLNEKTVEEIEKQSFIETISQFSEAMSDPALMKLFSM